MIRTVEDAGAATRAAFDEIIDVRSPAEYAQDHLPGAVNLPVLSDAERAEVGALYVQRSKFLARRVGAAYVSRNIADHLSGPLAGRQGDYRPMVYCWRGGQRSAAMATVLSQVGWRVGLLHGGYKTYRREVIRTLYESTEPLRLVVLCGPTGVGKTALLQALARHGVQTLDLEAMAGHRGSLFGDLPGTPQPSQKMFESRVAEALDGFDFSRPIVVEDEASRVGELGLPPRLWAAMRGAPGILLRAPAALRARGIAAAYGAAFAGPADILARLERLPRHHSREQRAHWAELALAGAHESLALALIEAHYDPAYRRAAAAQGRTLIGEIDVQPTGDPAIDLARLCALIDGAG